MNSGVHISMQIDSIRLSNEQLVLCILIHVVVVVVVVKVRYKILSRIREDFLYDSIIYTSMLQMFQKNSIVEIELNLP